MKPTNVRMQQTIIVTANRLFLRPYYFDCGYVVYCVIRSTFTIIVVL